MPSGMVSERQAAAEMARAAQARRVSAMGPLPVVLERRGCLRIGRMRNHAVNAGAAAVCFNCWQTEHCGIMAMRGDIGAREQERCRKIVLRVQGEAMSMHFVAH